MFKVGDKVVDGDGNKARIICVDAKGHRSVIALFEDGNGGEYARSFYADGRFHQNPSEEDIKPIPKTVWVNVYTNGSGFEFGVWMFPTKAEGVEFAARNSHRFSYLTTIELPA